MDIHLPDELATELKKRAKTSGTGAEEFAIEAIRRTLENEQRLEELLTPTREAFSSSGMTEDEAVELFEAEKHKLRDERLAK